MDASDESERIHNELSGHADVSIQAGHVHGGIHISYPDGRRRRSDDAAVEIEWTGDKPVTDFARRNWAYELLMVGSALLLCVMGIFAPASGDELKNSRLIAVALGAACYIAFWCQAKLYSIRVQKRMSPWSLCVGPRGIVASSAATTHELSWDVVAEVMVGPIKADPLYEGNAAWPYVFEGLHVRLAPGTPVPVGEPPTGWPISGEQPRSRSDGWLPICVLGPLTDAQRTRLVAALRRPE